MVNFYDPIYWTPFSEYCQSTAHTIVEQAKNCPENGLNIFVTHDFNVMTLRLGWFALLPDKWVKFLGGFAFPIEEAKSYFKIMVS